MSYIPSTHSVRNAYVRDAIELSEATNNPFKLEATGEEFDAWLEDLIEQASYLAWESGRISGARGAVIQDNPYREDD